MPTSTTQPQPWDSPSHEHPEPVPLVSESDLINPLLKVADVMRGDVRTCSRYSTAMEAALIFRDCDCGAVPITVDGKPIGIVTDRDVALALPDHAAGLPGVAVADLMSTNLVTVEADKDLRSAVDRFAEGVRRLVVVDASGQLAGLLSWTDLVPHLSERAVGLVVAKVQRNR